MTEVDPQITQITRIRKKGTEVGGWRSEGGGRKPEVGSQRSEVRKRQRSVVEGQRSEGGFLTGKTGFPVKH